MTELRKISFTILTLILSALCPVVNAQVPSYLGRFESDFDRGCAPFKIVLSEIDTFPPTTVIQYDFTNSGTFVGFEEGEEITFTYNSPGAYKIIQLSGIDYPGVSKLDTMDVYVFPPLNPEYSIFTCENNGARVEISADQYNQHKIFFTPMDSIIVNQGEEVPPFVYPPGEHTISVTGLFTNGQDNCPAEDKSFRTIENLVPAEFNSLMMLEKNSVNGAVQLDYQLPPDVIYDLQIAENFPTGFRSYEYLDNASSSAVIDSINTEDNIHIFRISAYDACQEKYLYSDTLSSITIDVTAENSQNRIEWRAFPLDFDEYLLSRDGQSLQSFGNVNVKVFIDHEVECFTTYCYFVQYSNDNGGISVSDTVCVESFRLYYPPAIKNTTASVNGYNIDLGWDDPENVVITSYFIQRQIESDVFATIDTTLIKQYTDVDLDTDTRGFCYRINYLDECRNRSNLGDLACTMFLSIEDNQLLEWNKYSGWRNGVNQFIVEVYDEYGILQDEINVGLNEWYEDSSFLTRQILQYRIRAESNDNPALISFSNFVVKQVESILWLPNSFTPNGDGLNDYFRPEGTQMKEYALRIYTRYGDLVFSTEDQNLGWDGTFNGKEMPPVTYIYKMQATDELDKKYNETGKLLLIRH